MTNIPYEERIKNRDNDWYYNKCIQQYYYIIKSQGANEIYKEKIKRLTKAKETTENEYGDLLKAFAKSETENKKEIARLNKIIDELEKYLTFQIRHTDKEYIFGEVYHKLKELKEEGKE
jgi:hypothetical protein